MATLGNKLKTLQTEAEAAKADDSSRRSLYEKNKEGTSRKLSVEEHQKEASAYPNQIWSTPSRILVHTSAHQAPPNVWSRMHERAHQVRFAFTHLN